MQTAGDWSPLSPESHQHKPGLLDCVSLTAFAVLAVSPNLLHREAILIIAGAVTLAFSLYVRSDEIRARLARSAAGAMCLSAAIETSWYAIWPIYLIIPLCGALIIGVLNQSLPDAAYYLRYGRFGRTEARMVGLITFVAAALLFTWFDISAPDLSALRIQVPDWPGVFLIGAGLIFATVNAALEEVIWRGIIQTWLISIFSAPLAIIMQALSFGAAHYYGFPSGMAGVSLAAGYGVLLGVLRWRSGGLLAPFLAHITADLTIFTMLARLA